jgi:hypothetical protein
MADPGFRLCPLFYLDTSLSLIELDNDRTYAYIVQGTTGTSTGTASDRIYVSTLPADSVHTFLRNGVLYFRGIDKDSPIKLIDLSGKTVQISNDSTFIPTSEAFSSLKSDSRVANASSKY